MEREIGYRRLRFKKEVTTAIACGHQDGAWNHLGGSRERGKGCRRTDTRCVSIAGFDLRVEEIKESHL